MASVGATTAKDSKGETRASRWGKVEEEEDQRLLLRSPVSTGWGKLAPGPRNQTDPRTSCKTQRLRC